MEDGLIVPILGGESIEDRLGRLEHTMRTHKHIGSDNTTKIGSAAYTVYHGFVVNSSSAGTPFPTGWSVANNGTGDCTITHNLGRTDYVVLATAEGTASIMSPQSPGANSIQILSYATTASSQSTDFYFAIIV